MYGYPSDDDQSYDPLGVNQPAYDPSLRGDDMIGDNTPLDQLKHWHSAYMTVEDYIYQCFELHVEPRPPRACMPGIDSTPTRSSIDDLFRTHQIASYLPYADFTIYNEAYHNNADHDSCMECNGRSGTLEGDTEGDGVYATYVERLNPCGACIDAGLCPGCSQPIALSYDRSAMPVLRLEAAPDYYSGARMFYDYDTYEYDIASGAALYSFSCLVCGWSYDPDRLAPSEPDYDDYEARADYYDDDPGFDPMFLI